MLQIFKAGGGGWNVHPTRAGKNYTRSGHTVYWVTMGSHLNYWPDIAGGGGHLIDMKKQS